MANQNPSVTAPATVKPVPDEWGLFDPKQAGVEALVRRVLSSTNDRDTAHAPAKPEAK